MKRSPLKEKPLKNPGESLDETIHAYVHDHGLAYFVVLLCFFMITVYEWLHVIFGLPITPWTWTVITAGYFLFVCFKIIRVKKKIRYMKQGRDAEKFVGQFLNKLLLPDAHIFHDIPGERFNLDHVVISPSGIFVIETKAPSKPLKGRAVIGYNGAMIDVNGYKTDEPLIQVKAASKWLKNLLKHGTGIDFRIQSIVVYPDWFVEERVKPERNAVRVVNHQFLPGLISSNNPVLQAHEVAYASDYLARYVRNYQIK